MTKEKQKYTRYAGIIILTFLLCIVIAVFLISINSVDESTPVEKLISIPQEKNTRHDKNAAKIHVSMRGKIYKRINNKKTGDWKFVCDIPADVLFDPPFDYKLCPTKDSIDSDFEILFDLANVNAIKSVDLTKCTRITGESLKHIKTISSLEELNLSGCPGINESDLEYLLALKNLNSLDISTVVGTGSRGGMDSLYGLLRSDKGLSIISKMPNLKRLVMKYCFVLNDKGLSYLMSLKNLEYLDISSCTALTGTGLKSIGKFNKLKHLDMSLCFNVDDSVLEALSGLSKLQYLNLMGCSNINDDSLKAISSFTNLEELILYNNCGGPKLTDDSIQHLSKLVKLKTLDIRGTNISTKGIKLLKESIPGCEIWLP